jgi:DNA-binding MarR family transcriptional regulator
MGKVTEEIRQTRPFEQREQEVLVTLLRTGDVLRHAIETALRPWKLSPEQYNVLRILRGARDEGHPTLGIAQRMVARAPNISRMVDKMIARGLVQRRRVEDDRRVALVRITGDGLSTLSKCDQALADVLDKLDCLKKGEMESLVELLDRVRGRLAVATCREGIAKKDGP